MDEVVAKGIGFYGFYASDWCLCTAFPSVLPIRTEASLVGAVGLELRMNGDDQVDVLVPVSRVDGDRFLQVWRDGTLGAWMGDAAGWGGLVQLFAWWDTTDSVLGRDRLVWLEFDVAARVARDGIPVPNAFVEVTASEKASDVLDGRRQRLYVNSLHAILCGRPAAPALLDRFDECVMRLPTGAFVRFCGRDAGPRWQGHSPVCERRQRI